MSSTAPSAESAPPTEATSVPPAASTESATTEASSEQPKAETPEVEPVHGTPTETMTDAYIDRCSI